MRNATNLREFLNSNFTIKECKKFATKQQSKLNVYIKPRTKQKHGVDNGRQWLYVRIVVNGIQATDFSTGISCEIGTWDKKTKQIKGSSIKIEEENRRIEQIQNDLLRLYNDLRFQGVNVTAKMLKDLYTMGTLHSFEHLRLTTYYNSFLSFHSAIVSTATLKGYKSRFALLREYLKSTKQQTVSIDQINPKWAMAFHRYILGRKCGLDYARRSLQTISNVIDFAVVQGDLENNPLKSLVFPRSPWKPIKYLTMVEVEQIQTCPYFDPRLQRVADCFLVQVFTGMSYNELLSFDPEKHLKTEADGQEWIMIPRGKTGTLSMIPVIEPAQNLLKKYGYRLPVITNQKMNDFIKEVAKVADIKNPFLITTHVGRKTAGMFLLNKGLSLETVSKVLGHKSIKVTQTYYAELLTETIKRNFKNSGLI